MTDRIRLDVDGPIATITNDHPDKHNAFDDEMDLALFEILGQLRERHDVRAVIWRGEGQSFSSGRDVASRACGIGSRSFMRCRGAPRAKSCSQAAAMAELGQVQRRRGKSVHAGLVAVFGNVWL